MAQAERTPDGSTVRVLVVDDEVNIADLLAMALRYEKWDVRMAHSGREAVEQAHAFAPDVVVLDMMLPDFDGLEVLRKLRAIRADVPVLFLTARDAVEDRIAGVTAGGDDYVTKPFSLEEVIARLRGLLRRSGAFDTASLNADASRRLDEIAPDEVPRTVDLPEYGSYRVMAGQGSDAARLVVGLPTASVDDTLSSLMWWELLLGVGATASAAAAARAIIRRQLAPLRSVAATANQVSAAPLATGSVQAGVRVPEELTDTATEVGQVGEALNRMLDHVEAALRARYDSEQRARQFLADASHELRTPLSTIKGYAELSRRTHEADPAPILAKVESEAARMTTLVEDMMLLARLDAGPAVDHRPVDLTRLLVEAVNDARVVDTERTWEINVPSTPVTVNGDEHQLHQAITNVLRNASRHTGPGTHVTVSLHGGQPPGQLVRVDVHDNGPGLAPDLLPHVFERFTRGDQSRSRRLGGAGLGMSLVNAIMTAHGGDATVHSQPGDTTFSLILPRP